MGKNRSDQHQMKDVSSEIGRTDARSWIFAKKGRGDIITAAEQESIAETQFVHRRTDIGNGKKNRDASGCFDGMDVRFGYKLTLAVWIT